MKPLLCKYNIILKHNDAFEIDIFLLLFQKDSLCILDKTLLENEVSHFARIWFKLQNIFPDLCVCYKKYKSNMLFKSDSFIGCTEHPSFSYEI